MNKTILTPHQTFELRNRKKCACGVWMTRKSKTCRKCIDYSKQTRFFNQSNVKNHTWREDITKEEVERLYLKEKWTMTQIGQHFNADDHVITRRFKLWNIKKRTQSEQRKLSGAQRNPNTHTGNRKEYLEIAKKFKEWKCERCEKTRTNESFDLVVHHVDENNRNNKIENLVVLCQSCHAYIHRKGKRSGEK